MMMQRNLKKKVMTKRRWPSEEFCKQNLSRSKRLQSSQPDALSESSRGTGDRKSLIAHGNDILANIIHRYVCHIDSTSLTSSNATSLSQQTVFATPVSRLLPRIRLRTRQAPSLLGQKILVTIDRWDSTSRYPDGHFVRALGKVESKEAEQESLLLEFEVPYRPFGRAILDCLPPEGDRWVVPPKCATSPEWRDREDLRDLLICSIDPPGISAMFRLFHLLARADDCCMVGCQDIDDALHARLLPNGNIEAGVRELFTSCCVHLSLKQTSRHCRCVIFCSP